MQQACSADDMKIWKYFASVVHACCTTAQALYHVMCVAVEIASALDQCPFGNPTLCTEKRIRVVRV